jgi:DNA polymerase
MDRSQLSEHLRFLRDLGVSGINRDPRWRRRDGTDTSEVLADSQPAAFDGSPAGGQPETAQAIDVPAIRIARGPADALAAIRSDIGDCTRCKLHRLGRRQVVFGVGSPGAELMFVGEAPGADEDLQGIPFVGRAGQLLTKMIEAMGFRRDEVYIANVIKCRPPENRNPEPDEIETCEPFLFQQIATIQPKVIVALGSFAAKTLLRTQSPISRLRGRVYEYQGTKLVPTFHPSYLLRSPAQKREAWEDLKVALGLLGREPPPRGGSQ